MAQLLVDVTPFKSVLKEAKGRPGVFEVEGVMQRAKAENQNGRVYKKAILEREADKYVKEFVERGNAFGELDHPESPVVSLKNASHSLTSRRSRITLIIFIRGGNFCYKRQISLNRKFRIQNTNLRFQRQICCFKTQMCSFSQNKFVPPQKTNMKTQIYIHKCKYNFQNTNNIIKTQICETQICVS